MTNEKNFELVELERIGESPLQILTTREEEGKEVHFLVWKNYRLTKDCTTKQEVMEIMNSDEKWTLIMLIAMCVYKELKKEEELMTQDVL